MSRPSRLIGLKNKFSLRSKPHLVPSIPSTTPTNEVQRIELAVAVQPDDEKLTYLWLGALGKLSSEERLAVEVFGPAQTRGLETTVLLEEVKEAIKRQGEKHNDKRWTINFRGQQVVLRDKVQKILIWVEKFKSIGDTIVSYDPVHMALPWAGFRFLLQATVAEGKQGEALILGLDTVAYLINRCKAYEILYLGALGDKPSQSELNLKRAALQLYTRILKFLAAATKLYRGPLGSRALNAILNPESISELIEECQKLSAIVHAEADNCEHDLARLSRMKDEDSFLDLKNILMELGETFNKIVVVKWVQSEEKVQFLHWISDLRFEDVHIAARSGRTEGTGKWLLNHKTFVDWRDDESSGILWLHGLPGTGKTKLVSVVVNDFTECLESDQTLAYFYCDINRRASAEVLRSILRQLVSSLNGKSIQLSLFNTYLDRKKKGFASTFLDDATTQKEFVKLVNSFPQSFIVIDALDECEKDVQAILVKALKLMISATTRPVKVLISSRPEPYIKNLLGSVGQIEVSERANIDDIKRFITESVYACPEDVEDNEYWSNMMPKGLREEICDVLLKGSGGMFQWVKLQVSQLRRMESERDVRRYLGKHPEKLKDLYNAIWTDIQHAEGDKPVIAKRAFQWLLSCFDRPSPEQLLLMVCQDPDRLIDDDEDEDSDEAIFPQPVFVDFSYVLTACRNLLVVDTVSGVCKFSHLSVQDHLEEAWRGRQSHAFASKICLLFLLNAGLNETTKYESDSEEEIRDWGGRVMAFHPEDSWHRSHEDPHNSMQRYASERWTQHVQAYGDDTDPDPQLATFLKQFLGSFDKGSEAFERYIKQQRMTPRPPVFFAAFFGFYNILLEWWDAGYSSLNQTRWPEKSLLADAVQGRSLELVRRLHEDGALLHPHMGYDNSILLIAVRNRDFKMAKLLLEAGASFEVESRNTGSSGYNMDMGLSCLRIAVQNSDIPIIRLLGDHGARFEFWDELDHVASQGNEKSMRYLLKHLDLFVDDADRKDNCNIKDKKTALRCALVSAAKHSYTVILQMLLDFGCSINAIDKSGHTLLSAAAAEGNMAMIQLLSGLGADLNPPESGGEQGSSFLYDGIPLTAAVESLVPDGSFHVEASESKKRVQEETVEMLLSLGADPDRKSGGYGNALSGAIHLENKTMVGYILGASPEAMARDENKPLLAAAASVKKLELVQILVTNGANVNTPGTKLMYKYPANWDYSRGRTFDTPLIEASVAGCLDIVQFLVAHGADVSAHGIVHESALSAAASEKHEEVVRFLLGCKAELNGKGGEYDETPLMALAGSYFFNLEAKERGRRIAALLLESGADMDIEGGRHGGALKAAEYRRDSETIAILLRNHKREKAGQVRKSPVGKM